MPYGLSPRPLASAPQPVRGQNNHRRSQDPRQRVHCVVHLAVCHPDGEQACGEDQAAKTAKTAKAAKAARVA